MKHPHCALSAGVLGVGVVGGAPDGNLDSTGISIQTLKEPALPASVTESNLVLLATQQDNKSRDSCWVKE